MTGSAKCTVPSLKVLIRLTRKIIMFQQVTIAELYWFKSDFGIIIQDRFSLE